MMHQEDSLLKNIHKVPRKLLRYRKTVIGALGFILVNVLLVSLYLRNDSSVLVDQHSPITKFLNQLSTDDSFRLEMLPKLSQFSLDRHSNTTGQTNIIISSGFPMSYVAKWQLPLINNVCYALKHNIGFKLDLDPIDISADTQPYARKIISIKNAIHTASTLLWLDLDTIVLRDDNLFTLADSYPDADLILADHSCAINNGVFFIRNTTWSLSFLDRFNENMNMWNDWAFCDNGAIMPLIMEEIASFHANVASDVGGLEALNGINSSITNQIEVTQKIQEKDIEACGPADQCQADSIRTELDKIYICFNGYLTCTQNLYNSRINAGRIAFIPQIGSLNRINQWYFGKKILGIIPVPAWFSFASFFKPYPYWNDEDYYKKGDAVVHTKIPTDFVTPLSIKSKCGEVSDEVWTEFFKSIQAE